MKELGIDISSHHSKNINEFLNTELDYVITVCDHANEVCPFFSGGKERMHQGFQDPAVVVGTDEAKLSAFRKARDEIRSWLVEKFG
jgi:arsenate reductase